MSLIDDITRYYAARAPIYDESAGYKDPEAEQLRIPIKARYREMFQDRVVLEIACGSGYWTPVIGETAKSVLAIDVNHTLLAIARDRCSHLPNVAFQIADAYNLDGIPAGFTAAFGNWWWSHVPRSDIARFLATLHSRLTPGAFVLFVDQLPYHSPTKKRDPEGNSLEQRSLPDGRTFEIVKNFPTEQEVESALADIADNIRYIERPDEKSWNVMYNTKA